MSGVAVVFYVVLFSLSRYQQTISHPRFSLECCWLVSVYLF